MKLFIKSAIVVLILLGTILGYVREVPYFSNTFDIRYLFFRFLLFGGIIGAIAGWFLMQKLIDRSDRVPLILVCFVAGLAIFPLVGISSNHFFAKKKPLSMKVIFQKEEALRTSRMGVVKNSVVTVDAFYVYFTKDYQVDRIRTKNQSFRNIEAGQEIELPVKHGFWGFDFVEVQ